MSLKLELDLEALDNWLTDHFIHIGMTRISDLAYLQSKDKSIPPFLTQIRRE